MITISGAVILALVLFVAAPDLGRLARFAGLMGPDVPAAAAPGDILSGGAAIRPANGPPPGSGEHPSPLGKPERAPASGGPFAYMQLQTDGKPVTYDPCREIHYVTRSDHQPEAGPSLIEQAVREVSRVTGLRFVNDGTTTENPTQGTVTLGLGGSEGVAVGSTGATYVTGQVTLNAAGMVKVIRRDGLITARAVVEHELAHVVGLSHVEDPTQLMNPVATPGVVTFGNGDLTGLATLGTGPCRPDL
ncbi:MULTISPECIES: matrixin family metalloprotease [Arthrobacter]|uniref:Matrixin family metalloprotease n=2 Tax=Arthrobacter TaxID=1663 RepID=A0ABU9KIB2_9MICC|nr:hypothetical protein [Arthrobacter sp. YJM1]